MKIIRWAYLLLLIPLFLNAQVLTEYQDVKDLFSGNYTKSPAAMNDTIQTQYNFYDAWGRHKIFYTISSDTTVNVLTTKIVSNRYHYADMDVTFGILQDTAHVVDEQEDTMNVSLNMGVFRGFGFGSQGGTTISLGELDSTGWVEYNLFSVNAKTQSCPDTCVAISLRDSTWWTDYPTSEYYFKITENDTTRNRYFLNVFQFGED